ncbi:hypothetical protein NJF44_08900 [Pseudomonas guariconensis]|uniref:hypothetical protein n=1 Tax=Pseudomonas TaxID=286 RepID=UPI002097F3DA|nr:MULTISPECIES: hypothetical protein [Pseudomonas]MCO7513847.1 hypothetical protein [Pseudomonas putida]MCO7605350.1 hypothetical protein [Pseudomonas guariconensis]
MLNAMLIAGLLLLAPSPAHALETTHLPPERLHALGSALANKAGSSQWQLLWQNVRTAGYLTNHPTRLHFSVPHRELPILARETLAQADQVEALERTRARYRRDFHPQVIGRRDGQALNALCLVVDWRAVPHGMRDRPEAYLRLARLLDSYPCD